MTTLVKYVVEATIASGGSLSDALDLGEGRAALIQMPADWTAADLTFQVSVDGTNFWSLYKADDTEYKVEAAEDRTILLELSDWLGIRHLKVRSGTAGTPVNQGAARILKIGVVA